MPGSVIRRLGHSISEGGQIDYQEEPATWADADAVAGRRVDRRRCYAIMAGEDGNPVLCESVQWTDDCSGCTEIGDYGVKYGPGGCRECGYTGRRRTGYWLPVEIAEAARAD